jgi:nucleotide-binding universal stress UspA family protein
VAVRVVPLSDTRVPKDQGPLAYLGPHRLLTRRGDSRLESAAQTAQAAGVDTQTVLVAAADAAAAIAEVANRHDASVILLEPPGGGRLARFRGHRLARQVRRHSRAPVFIVGRAPVSIAERSR